ncbi:MAG: C10 family peptidase [Muribaculaceae bacterium]|nr:C10 family peptidase [Muribaculaceae bacterium]
MTKHLRRLVSAMLLTGTVLTSLSETVAVEEARSIAAEFVSSMTGKSADSIRLKAVPTTATPSTPLYYVFNNLDNAGFVIVSAETSATPILGYSFDSTYPEASVPEAMQWMMSGLENEIRVAPKQQSSLTKSEFKKLAGKSARAAEAKRLSTPSWSQESPFNNLIPGKPLVGCVGTAMATVMKFHQFPQSGTGSFDGVDFNVVYNWDDMRNDNYRSGYTSAEAEAVATLMYHASKSIDTQYAMSGSSAYEVRVPAALSAFFGYDPGVSYKKRSEVATQEAWDRIVKDEIDAGRPVIYCGQDVTAGHAFVCDGYQGDYLYFNWGWGGSANGYFLSTALNPTVSRQHHYNNLNTIIYNIKPGSGVIRNWSPIHITADGNQPGIGSDLTDLNSGDSFKVRVGNLKNLSYDKFSGKIAVALFDKNGAMKVLLCTPSSFNLESMATLFSGYIEMNGCKLPAGTSVASDDFIRLVTQANGQSDWLPVAGELPTVNELAVNAAPATFAVNLPSAVAGVKIEGQPTVIRGWDYSFKVTPENPVEDVVTVKANGMVLTPGNNDSYVINNVCADQTIAVLVQKASEVKAKRSVWVETPGTLSSLISDEESGTIRELTVFGSIDARDFAFMRNNMSLQRIDISGAYISAYGTDQANAIPREAFRGISTLNEVVLPSSVNRLNNGCFRQCGITTITIPAGVKTYEYNIFVADSKLRHIYVGRENAEFINWCVLSGVNVNALTLHVPTERAVENYRKAENWGTIANIIVDPVAASSDVLFAVMDHNDVKFESETTTGTKQKGSKVSFTATYTADNDNRMDVYANSTLLTPDADGVYSTTLNTNTIIHFGMVEPTEVLPTKSQWTLTAKNGSIGLFTDAVNVIPGQDFTIRVNALNIPAGYEQFYWAAALTDSKGNIKEFISPINLWTAGSGDGFKMNIDCRVNDSNVREGNTVRLVTSPNKKQWALVHGADETITASLPALNNQTPVYNITLPELAEATISGVPATAVRGRDITMKITPSSAAYRIDVTANGKEVVKGQASVNYTFVVMEDITFDVNVYDPKAEGTVTYNVAPGMLDKMLTEESVCANVVVVGQVYSMDLQHATGKDCALKTIKSLDLRGVKIVAQGGYEEDVINHPLFIYPDGRTTPASSLEALYLPDNVVRIAGQVFKNCGKIKEITLPLNLRSVPVKVGSVWQYGLASDAFLGCDELYTIRIPGAPGENNGRQIVAHHSPYSTTNSFWYTYYNLGHKDPKKVTVIVPEEYLSVYRTAYNDGTFGNPWKAHGYNILSEVPVYGVKFDPARVVADENVDVANMASFLGDNVALNSVKVEGKLRLAKPETACRVYDNGTEIQPAADGSLSVEFLNPAKYTEGVGNHEIKVVYTYDVDFETTSPLFTISEPEITSDSDLKSGEFDRTNTLSPVLKNVAENSNVRFRLDFDSEHAEAMEARVVVDMQEITPDADGMYSLAVTNAPVSVKVFAVPTDGATLNAEELASIDPAHTKDITTIALTGEVSADDLAQALECFPSLENLDLSEMEGSLPEGAFSGMTSLTTVALPETTSIADNMFSGCTSLQSVDIPPTVTSVGNGAFQGCESLNAVRLTGIDAIGENAFDGCSSLTTITILNDLAGSASQNSPMSRGKRQTGIHNKAFSGVNPNCIIVLDEGIQAPVSDVNIIYTTTGTVTETMADGSEIHREGRIYTAKADVNFVKGYPLAIPHTFALAEGTTVNMRAENNEWGSIMVPFDPEMILDDAGEEVEISEVPEFTTSVTGKNLLYTLKENGEVMTSTSVVSANTPYMLYTLNNMEVVFTAANISVPSTPAEISVNGKEFSLHGSYSNKELPAEGVYTLNSDKTAFAPVEEETVKINPFDIYATAPVSVAEISTGLPNTSNGQSAVEMEAGNVDTLVITVEGDILVIFSPDRRKEMVYTTDGRAVKEISLEPGRNQFKPRMKGVFIIADKKVKI